MEQIFKIKSTSFQQEVKKHIAHAVKTPRTQEPSFSLNKEMHADYLQRCEHWLLSCLWKTTIREQWQQNFLPIL